MQEKNTKGGFKSGVISTIKYVVGMAMFGMLVLLVVATYVSAN